MIMEMAPALCGGNVVVGPSTTKECRGWSIHDKRGPGAHVPAGASGPGVTATWPSAGGSFDDHGISGCPATPNRADPGQQPTGGPDSMAQDTPPGSAGA